MKMNEKAGCRSDFWLGFTFGGVVGGFLALLFTTEGGKKIREKISEEGGGWADQAIDGLSQIVTDLEKKTERVKEEGGEKFAQKLKRPLQDQVLKEEAKAAPKSSEGPPKTSSRRRFFKKGSKKS